MSRFVSLLVLFCISATILLCFPARLLPQDQNQGLQPAKILEVISHPEGRMYNYVGDNPAPVYDRYPYYDLKMQLGGDCYVARYEAQTGYYPENWKSGGTVQTRMGSGVIYLVRYDG